MAKRVSLYKKSDRIYVLASHQTKAGFWIDDDKVTVLERPTAEDLQVAVAEALARSKEGLSTPSPPTESAAPLLAAAGAASWNTFILATRYVGVRQNGDAIKITPYRNSGGKDGFEPLQDRVTNLPSNNTGIGQAVTLAFEAAI